jgi:hypothetical protein
MRVYLVQRRALRETDCEWFEDPAEHPGGGFQPWKTLRMLASEEAAHAFAEEVRLTIRREINPAAMWFDLRDVTSLGIDELCLRVAELGLPLPPESWNAGYREPWPVRSWNDFCDWWAACIHRMSEEQRDGVWALLDRLELVRVTPLTLHD